MTYTVIVEPSVERDIAVSYEWGRAQWGEKQAVKWAQDLRKTMMSLCEFPERCKTAPENGAFTETIRQLLFQRYRILFTIRGTAVHILYCRGAYDSLSP